MTTLWIVVGVVGYLAVGVGYARWSNEPDKNAEDAAILALEWGPRVGLFIVMLLAIALCAAVAWPLHLFGRLAGGK